MFSPGFDVLDRAWARLSGYERRFWHPSVRNWGTDDAPAPTCCLVPGPSVDGVAYLVEPATVAWINRREAMEPIAVEIDAGGRHLAALTWTMRRTWEGATAAELADHAIRNRAAGGGPSGDAVDYVAGVAAALRDGPGTDRATSEYLEALDARGTFT